MSVRLLSHIFPFSTSGSACCVFVVGFSDDRRLVVLTLVLFVLVIIVVGIAGRHRVAHERPVNNSGERWGVMSGSLGAAVRGAARNTSSNAVRKLLALTKDLRLSALRIGSRSGRGYGYGRDVGVSVGRKPLITGSLTASSSWLVVGRTASIWSRRDCRTGRHRRPGAVILWRPLGLRRGYSGCEKHGCGRQDQGIFGHTRFPSLKHFEETYKTRAPRKIVPSPALCESDA
jgi:hypothetical protein